MSDRQDLIHRAKVYLREARLRRGNPVQRGYSFVLLGWAANCRRRAMRVNLTPMQYDLFGGAS